MCDAIFFSFLLCLLIICLYLFLFHLYIACCLDFMSVRAWRQMLGLYRAFEKLNKNQQKDFKQLVFLLPITSQGNSYLVERLSTSLKRSLILDVWKRSYRLNQRETQIIIAFFNNIIFTAFSKRFQWHADTHIKGNARGRWIIVQHSNLYKSGIDEITWQRLGESTCMKEAAALFYQRLIQIISLLFTV